MEIEDVILRLIGQELGRIGVQFMEVRYERTTGTGITIVDGVTREVGRSINAGIGVRAFSDGAWGFSATTVLKEPAIKDTIESAAKIAKRASKATKEKFELKEVSATEGESRVPVKVDPRDVSVQDKVRFVMDLDRQATAFSPKVVNVNCFMGETLGQITIINSFGTHVKKEVSRVRAGASVYVAEDGVRERSFEGVGGTGGYEILQSEEASMLGEAAAKRAVKLLDAKPAPSGKFTVVMDPRLVGVFIHEAFGHACEADKVIAGASIIEGRIGDKMGSESITVVDDPSIRGLYGSFSNDDEGIPAHPRVLVERGVMKGYLHSVETASRLNAEPNGAARAQDFMSTPIVRMSNTYIAKGDCKVDEVFEGVKYGIYALGSEYGYVIPASGQFTFKCDYAHIIKDGEPRGLIRDAALSGLILEALNNVEVVGNDLSFEPGVCGKAGQSVPVTTGGPHVRVANVVVGGVK
ncbi:MAG: TldD/PmbA family protein [Promethearchaeati archaeon SRVP18_Atabeyarchaeia-1]